MEYISYNVGTRDFPDIYARALGPAALGIYIRQIPRAHVITITYKNTILCIAKTANNGLFHEVQIFMITALLTLAEILTIQKLTILSTCNQHFTKFYRSFVGLCLICQHNFRNNTYYFIQEFLE